MTMTAEERSFVTTAIVSVAIGLTVLGVGFEVLERTTAEHKLVRIANPGDTPVVLIGGSMVFKAAAYQTPQAWSTDTPNKEYHVSPAYQISTIVLKAIAGADNDNLGSGDANATTDKLRLDVSTANTWEIDEFSVAGGGKPVVKLVPKQNGTTTEIHLVLLDPGGMLCPVNSNNMIRISYSPTQNCPAPAAGSQTSPVFSQVSVILNGEVTSSGAPQPSATLNCIDSTDSTGDPAGKCRIVFRGPPS
jgi:hypothetical protein